MAIPNFGHSGLISNSQAMAEVAIENGKIATKPGAELAEYFTKNAPVIEDEALKEVKKREAKVGVDTYKTAYDKSLVAAGAPTPQAIAAADVAGRKAVKDLTDYGEVVMSVKSSLVMSFQGAAWSGFVDTLSAGFNEGVQNLNNALHAATAGLQNDPTDPSKLAKVQSALSEYTIYRNSQSNMSKAFKDIASSAAQNLR